MPSRRSLEAALRFVLLLAPAFPNLHARELRGRRFIACEFSQRVIAGFSPAIYAFLACGAKDVDARIKSGHDEENCVAARSVSDEAIQRLDCGASHRERICATRWLALAMTEASPYPQASKAVSMIASFTAWAT